MSKSRQERLKQLEQEREYFYRQQRAGGAGGQHSYGEESHLIRSPIPSNSAADGGAYGYSNNNNNDTEDFAAMKQRLGITSPGSNNGGGGNYYTDNNGSGVDRGNTSQSSNQNYQQQQQQQPKLASQTIVDDILKATRPFAIESQSASNSGPPIWSNEYGNQRTHSPSRPIVQPQRARVDAFEKLVTKDQKTRQKYHVSDKSMLEDERARTAALEDSYSQLLRQVQQLQNTHLIDLRNAEQRFHSASAALQKALVSKSEELVTLSNRLASSEGRYERDSREWAKERIALLNQVETLSTTSADQISKIADREARLNEMNRLRKELAERIAVREQDLIKYGKALRDRESDFAREKDNRLKLEQKVLNFEQHQTERDGQFRELQNQLHRKTLEAEELAGLKIVYNESKRDLDDFTRREKHYNTEIEQMAGRERKLFQQVEELSANDRKHNLESSKLLEKQASLMRELEEKHIQGDEMGRELETWKAKCIQNDSDLSKYEKQARQYQQDSTRLLQEFTNVQQNAQDYQASNQTLNKELLALRNSEEILLKEKDISLTKITNLSKDLVTKTRELEEERNECRQLSQKLDLEVSQQSEMRLQSKEKFAMVTTKITELQETLVEAQSQLTELRANEKTMRAALKQKDESIKVQAQSIADSEARIQDLLQGSSRETMEYEAHKNKKREEILAIQDKYTLAKQAMDSEVTQLKYQLSQKMAQYNTLADDFDLIKRELNEFANAKMHLESRLSELAANEGMAQRQIANLTAALTQKNQELGRVSSKNMALVDQSKRYEEEVALYRDNTSNVRDADITRLQSNMEEISKRLKSQVDVLLDKDVNPLDVSGGRSSQYGNNNNNSGGTGTTSSSSAAAAAASATALALANHSRSSSTNTSSLLTSPQKTRFSTAVSGVSSSGSGVNAPLLSSVSSPRGTNTRLSVGTRTLDQEFQKVEALLNRTTKIDY